MRGPQEIIRAPLISEKGSLLGREYPTGAVQGPA